MSDNNVNNNHVSEKEIMKINNVDIPLDKWTRTVAMLSKTAENIIKGNSKEELYRDYKQLNIKSVKDFMIKKINRNQPIQILDNMNDEFKLRVENFVELLQINKKAKPILEKMVKEGKLYEYIVNHNSKAFIDVRCSYFILKSIRHYNGKSQGSRKSEAEDFHYFCLYFCEPYNAYRDVFYYKIYVFLIFEVYFLKNSYYAHPYLFVLLGNMV